MSTTPAFTPTERRPDSAPWLRRAIWLIVVSGLLTGWATLEHQPDPTTRFEDWSAFVTTDKFLATHLLGSILGQGLYLAGTAALAVAAYQATSRRRSAAAGFAVTALGTSGLLAGFGLAAFAQPAVGRLTLDGQAEQGRLLYDQLYGPGTIAVLVVSGLLYATGSVVLARAVAAIPGVPRWAAVAFGASGPLIAVLGVLLGFLQTVGTIALVAATVRIMQATGRLAAPDSSDPQPDRAGYAARTVARTASSIGAGSRPTGGPWTSGSR